jgi:large subunit ribosomal protein L9
MEVLLLERIEKLGQMGDVVKVKDGYARNFLLPQKKALRATADNRSKFEVERAQLETTNLERRKEAEAVGDKLAGTSYVLLRQASDMGQLYGSVSSRDIADALTEGGFTADKRQIKLTTPIKNLGVHAVNVALHPELSVIVSINVARSAEEAETQTAAATNGKAPATAEFFESEEAAREAEETLAEDEADNGDSVSDSATSETGESSDEEATS